MRLILKISVIFFCLILIGCTAAEDAVTSDTPTPELPDRDNKNGATATDQPTDIPTSTVEPTITPTSTVEPTITPTSTVEFPPEEPTSEDEPVEPQYELRRVLDNGHIEYHYRFQDNDTETTSNTMTLKDIERLFTIPSSCKPFINLENNVISIEIPGDGILESENIECGIIFNFVNKEFESKDLEAVQVARIQYSLHYGESGEGNEIKYNYYINLNKNDKYKFHESQFQFAFKCLDISDNSKTFPVVYSNGLYTFFKTESSKLSYDLFPADDKTMRPNDDTDLSFLPISNGAYEGNFLLNYESLTRIPGTVTVYHLKEDKSPVISDVNEVITRYRSYKDELNETTGMGGLNCFKPWPYYFGIQTVGGAGIGVKIHDIYIETIPLLPQENTD